MGEELLAIWCKRKNGSRSRRAQAIGMPTQRNNGWRRGCQPRKWKNRTLGSGMDALQDKPECDAISDADSKTQSSAPKSPR